MQSPIMAAILLGNVQRSARNQLLIMCYISGADITSLMGKLKSELLNISNLTNKKEMGYLEHVLPAELIFEIRRRNLNSFTEVFTNFQNL